VEPIVAALALAAPSVLRCARDLLRVAVVDHGGQLHIGFLDFTPGGNGTAAAIDEALLTTLLRMAQAVLCNVSPDELGRVKELHGEVPRGLGRTWDLGAARAWLDQVVAQPEPGGPIDGLAAQPYSQALLERVREVFPPVQWFPQEEVALFLESIAGCLDAVPMRARYGALPTEADRLCAAAGLCAVFYRRPDLHPPDDFAIVFEPGRECRDAPGAAGYCRLGDYNCIAVALDALRESIPLDTYSVMTHEAGHLFDALDGAADGLLSGMSANEKRRWMETAAQEIPRAMAGQSLLPVYAATSVQEFLAEAVAAFVELPQRLRDRLPPLYSGLRSALRQDPARWADEWDARKR
jgi:hypothetical protein